MKSKRFENWAQLLVWVMVAMIVVPGCASQQQKQRKKKTARRAPVTREAPQRTEPAPRVVDTGSDGGMVTRTLNIPTGDRATSAMSLVKSAPSEVNLGAPFEYTLTAYNLTNQVLEGVSVSDTIPPGLEILGSEPPADDTTGGKHTWSIGDIPAGGSTTIRVRARASQQGTFKHCAEGSYNQQVCVETRVVEPALALTKTMPAEVLSCDPIPVTLTVTNNGTGTARNVVVTDTLPAGLVTSDGRNSFTTQVGNLPAGQSRELRFEARAQSTGDYENTANAQADGDLTASASASVRVVNCDLAISKSGPERTFAGRNVEYVIKLTNNGDAPAKDCRIEDDLPANATVTSTNPPAQVGGGRAVWNIGTLPAGDSRTVTITLRATTIGTLSNTARGAAYCCDPVADTATTRVEGIPAILLEVIDVEDPIPVGSNVTYVIRVTNQGSAVGTNIAITCDMEDQAEIVTAAGATNHSASGKTVSFSPLPTLAPQAVAEWRVTVKAIGAGDVRFKVAMTSDQIQRPVEETEATNFYE